MFVFIPGSNEFVGQTST